MTTKYTVTVGLQVPISGAALQPHMQFGPFPTEDAAYAFVTRVNGSDKWYVENVDILNVPEHFDTDQALCLE